MTTLVRPDLVYAWKGASLLIVNTQGACADDQQLAGYYFRETRFVRTLALTIDGEIPWLCEAASPTPEALAFTYVYPEIRSPGGGGTGQSGDAETTNAAGIPERSLDVRVSYRVGVAHLDIIATITNRARREVRCELGWSLDADFADIQEAQAGRRQQSADVTVNSGAGITFSYQHPHLPFSTRVRGEGAEWRWSDSAAVTSLSLLPQQSRELVLSITPCTGRDPVAAADEEQRQHTLQEWRATFARIETPGDDLTARIVESNVRDIGSFPLLDGQPDEWLALQAGMPLYPAFFGRDAVTAGWQAAYIDRGEALAAALIKLARLQSDRFDDWRDEQPGRIPYQVRTGPLAVLNLNPYAAYYADYASPLMFVIALANLWAWTGDERHVERHWDVSRRILDWARELGDSDGDGYLEYQTRSSEGTKNQGWKDSGDAIVYDDGSPVPAPIATCELQGYWYLAQELMALLCAVRGATADAKAYLESASQLKERFNRDWWMEHERFYALALDPAKRQVRAITSNVGHCIACGIVDRERLPAVVGRMFAPDVFSGWGIRTLSEEHAFYNPLSYHRGTVWAVEQATIIFGLRRFGFDARALELARALFDLAQLYPDYRIPECIGGFARGRSSTPGAYPRANTPQLWNATAFPLVMQTVLGIVPIAAANTLMLDPVLPTWIPELVLRDLRVGESKVTLRIWRDQDQQSKWEVLHQKGTLHIVRQPALESLSAGWGDRAAALIDTILH